MAARVGRDRPLNEGAVRLSVTQEKLQQHKRRLARKEVGAIAEHPHTKGKARKPKPNNNAFAAMSPEKLNKKLFNACKHGSTPLVIALLEKRVSPNARAATFGHRPLHVAVQEKQMAVVDILLQYDADINAQDSNGLTPLHTAAKMRDPLGTRQLLKHGARSNTPDHSGQTAVHYSILAESLEVLAVLLKDAPNIAIDLKDDMGMTPLLTAAGLGYEEHLGMLLRRNADASICTEQGLPPLHLATHTGHLSCIRELMKYDVGSVGIFDTKGRTAVHLAASNGNPTALEVLLAEASAIDILDEIGRTPLHHAVFANQQEIVGMLIDRQASVEIRDTHGGTPIHYALQQGHDDLVDILAQANASTDVLDLAGRTPLVWGIIHNKYLSCKKLIAAGALINVTDIQKFTPLHYAAHAGRGRVCQMLVNKGAALDALDTNNHSPIFRAVIEGHIDCVKILLAAGAQEHLQDNDGRNCLHWAASNNQRAIVEALLEQGCPHDAEDLKGMQPIHDAASRGLADVVGALLDANADPNSADETGATPLHWAALDGSEDGHVETCQLLLAKGADVAAVDNGNPPQNAYQFAEIGKHTRCAALLKEALWARPGSRRNADDLVLDQSPASDDGSVDPQTQAYDGGDDASAADADADADASPNPTANTVADADANATNDAASSPRASAPSSAAAPPTTPRTRKYKTEDTTTAASPPAPSQGPGSTSPAPSPSSAPTHAARGEQARPEPAVSPSREKLREQGWDNTFHGSLEIRDAVSREPKAAGRTTPLSPEDRDAILHRLLAQREDEIRALKAKNRELSKMSKHHGASGMKKTISRVETKCSQLRSTLEEGKACLGNDANKQTGSAKARRRELKKQVKAALEEVSKLRTDTELLANTLAAKS